MGSEMLERLEKKAMGYYPGQGHHGFDHTQRVLKLVEHIAREEGADLEIVQAAALLHDIARAREDAGKIGCHAETGAREAAEILEKIGFAKEKIPRVQECIAVHRASKGMKAETLEAEILQDADRLDVIGAVGIGRVFHRAGAKKAEMYDEGFDNAVAYRGQLMPALNHLIVKSINALKPENFNTTTGREIAKKRHEFVKRFVDEFIGEWKGKR